MEPITGFVTKVIAGLTAKGIENFFANQAEKKKFERDLAAYRGLVLGDLDLAVFDLGRKSRVDKLRDKGNLPNLYIPLRVNQLQINRDKFIQDDPGFFLRESMNGGRLEDIGFWNLLKLINDYPHYKAIMVQGGAGAGKSTFMKYLTHSFLEQEAVAFKEAGDDGEGGVVFEEKAFPHFYVPILVRLRELERILEEHGTRGWEQNFHLGDFLQAKYQLPTESQDFYNKLLRHTPVMVLFDGIDEVPEKKKLGKLTLSNAKAQKWIINQKRVIASNNDHARFILTSRPNKADDLWREFRVFEVQDFSGQEVAFFTNAWYEEFARTLQRDMDIYPQRKKEYEAQLSLLGDSKAQFLTQAEKDPLREIVQNPLLLSLALLMHSVDGTIEVHDTRELYKNFIETFLYRWDDVRGMDFYQQLMGGSERKKLFILAYRLAYLFSARESVQMAAEEILPELKKHAQQLNPGVPAEDIEDLALELLRVFRDRGGLLTGQEIDEDEPLKTTYQFQHKTFQEYLTAYAIHEGDLLEEVDLNKKVGDELWEKTIDFYLLLGNSKRFFKEFLSSKRNREKYQKHCLTIAEMWMGTPPDYRDFDWKEDLEEWLVGIFMNTTEATLLARASRALIQLKPREIGTIAKFVIDFSHGDETEAYRFGRSISLLQQLGEWSTIREVLKVKVRMLYHSEAHYLLPLAEIQWSSFFERDLEMLRFFEEEMLVSLKAGIDSPGGGGYLLIQLIFIDLWYLLDRRDLRDLLDRLDLRDRRDLRVRLDLRDLRGLRGLRGLLGRLGRRDRRVRLDRLDRQERFITSLQNHKQEITKALTPYVQAQIAHLDQLIAEEQS